MTIQITEGYVQSIVNAMANTTPENIQAYFENLKLLPDGEEIIEAVQARMLQDFFEAFFPTERGVPLVTTKMAIKQFEEERLNAEPREVDTFAFYSTGSVTDEDYEECGCTDHCEEEEFQYEIPGVWFRGLGGAEEVSEEVSELSSLISNQKKQDEINKIIQAANEAATPELEGLKALIGSQLQQKSLAELSLAELIAEQVPASEKVPLSAEEVATNHKDYLLNLCESTLALLNGTKTSAEITYDFAQELNEVLATIVNEIINSNLVDDNFGIGDYSISLYEYVFAAIYNDLLMAKGIIENPDFAYQTEYTAYIMSELSRYYVEEKGYSLSFVYDEGIVSPVLKATN